MSQVPYLKTEGTRECTRGAQVSVFSFSSPPTIWSWNFSLNPLISSLERVKMFWWEREGRRVIRGEEGNKKKERGIEKEERSCWTSDAAKKIRKVRRLLGSKSDKGCWQLGWVTCSTREKHYTHLFQFSCIHTYIYIYIYIYIYSLHSHLSTQNNITLHTHIYILTFIRFNPSP